MVKLRVLSGREVCAILSRHYTGKIPKCPGVIAFGDSLYRCEEELRSALEGWLIVKIRYGDKLPVMGGINLNKKMPTLKEAAIHG